jgi:hypothetical protein
MAIDGGRPSMGRDQHTSRRLYRRLSVAGAAATVLLAFGAPATHATDPSLDPGGWRQFKWGMSYEQVQTLSGGKLVIDYGVVDDKYSDLFAHMEDYLPDGTPIKADFTFRCDSRGLYAVAINFPKSEPNFMPNIEAQYSDPDKIADWNRDEQLIRKD